MQTESFEYCGRHICITRCKKKSGPVIRTITVRRSLQIDVIARNDASNEAIRKYLNDNWYLIKDSRGSVNLNYASCLLREKGNYPNPKRNECPSGPFELYKVCPQKTFLIDVYAYRQLQVSSPTYFDIKDVDHKKSAIILFPVSWKEARIKKWVYDSKDIIYAQFHQKYGSTIVERAFPKDLYSLVPDWKIIFQYEPLASISYRLDKQNKVFFIKAPLDYNEKDIRNWLNNETNRIKQELESKSSNTSGIIGFVRKKSNGCNFAISPAQKFQSNTSHNASNSHWRGTGWIRDITETPSERAANVREGNRLHRNTPITTQYTKISDMRGLGIINTDGRLAFIEKKSDAWIEDKNN